MHILIRSKITLFYLNLFVFVAIKRNYKEEKERGKSQIQNKGGMSYKEG